MDARIPRAASAPGWAGERVVARHYDDWEPAIATDPNAPYVYRLVTRYGGPTACPKDCPDPAIILQVSKDDGRHWGPFRFLCTCKGTHGMYDPEIEVADDTGTVQAAFMRNYTVWFVRSSDHGKTWSKPVPVYGDVAWQDKPLLASSADGNDVYVAFNGPSAGDAYVAFSHDGGKTWDQRKVTTSGRYLYAFGGQVLSDGTVVYAESSLRYSGNGRGLKGANRTVILRSVNGGTSWTHGDGRLVRAGTQVRLRRLPCGLLRRPHGARRGWRGSADPGGRRVAEVPRHPRRLRLDLDGRRRELEPTRAPEPRFQRGGVPRGGRHLRGRAPHLVHGSPGRPLEHLLPDLHRRRGSGAPR